LLASCLQPITSVEPVPEAAGVAQTIAAGAAHTCVVGLDGTVRCWGAAGLVGDGTLALRVTPVAVTLDSVTPNMSVTAIAAGLMHTCALSNFGQVSCWGQNERGELGLGTTTAMLQPVQVEALGADAVQIAAGDAHTCALLITGRVVCWGVNDQFQLGAGASAEALTPVAVADLADGIRDVSAGAGHTCVVVASGQVHCWGGNAHGQLGTGIASAAPVAKPQHVPGLPEPMMMVRAGRFHTCAVSAQGEVWCWGRGGQGALGDDTSLDRLAPVKCKGLPETAVALAVGDGSTCAVLSGGATYCWGRNDVGQLGDQSRIPRSAPTAIEGLESRNVALGAGYACVVTLAHHAMCWGRNEQGQLGDGSTQARDVPARVVGL